MSDSAGDPRPSPAPAAGAVDRPQSVGDMLELGRAFLARKGVEEARLDADLLVAHALGVDRLHLLLRLDQPVSDEELSRARGLLQRRARREPVAYITGMREFYGRPFGVGEGVLIPRPETELLVDLARDHLARKVDSPRILDVGTGSGCLAITLALELPQASVHAVDLGHAALGMAQANAEQLGVQTITWHEQDGLEAAAQGAPWDLIVSNPPYICLSESDTLAPEVRDHEPAQALFAPEGDPDFWVRRLTQGCSEWLRSGGLLLVELGFEQGQRALEMGREANSNARLEQDLAGIPRVLAVGR